MRRGAALLSLCVMACGGDPAADRSAAAVPAAQVAAQRAWARAADSGGLTAAYFVLTNTGAGSDTLKAIRSTAAAQASMHVSMDRGGTMQMVPVGSLPVRPRDSVVFQPLGTHVMLTGLRQSLYDGDTIPLTLDFASGTSLAVPVIIRRP